MSALRLFHITGRVTTWYYVDAYVQAKDERAATGGENDTERLRLARMLAPVRAESWNVRLDLEAREVQTREEASDETVAV